MGIKIEFFSTPRCSHCDRSRDSLKAIAQTSGAYQVTWRDVSPLDELGYAAK